MDEARRTHYNVTFAILALAGMAYALLQSLVLPALRPIQLDPWAAVLLELRPRIGD